MFAGNVLLVVFNLARLRAALRLAARVFPLRRHSLVVQPERVTIRKNVTRSYFPRGKMKFRLAIPMISDGFHARVHGDIYRCNGAGSAMPHRRQQIDNKNAATWRSKIIIKPRSRDKYIHTYEANPAVYDCKSPGARSKFRLYRVSGKNGMR